jgi:glycosyltransferase involved in cell wall biosynthesis
MSSPSGRRFVYFLGDGLPATVVHSQVFTVLRRLAERGLVFDLYVNQVLSRRAPRGELAKRLAEVRGLVPGRVHLWTWPGPELLVKRGTDEAASSSPARTSTRKERALAALRRLALKVQSWLTQARLLGSLADAIWRREVIVVHSRGATIDVGIGLKRWYSGFRVVTDVRGDAPAEYLYLAARRGLGPDDPLVRGEHDWLRRRQRNVLAGSDAVQCVSEALRSRLAEDYGLSAREVRVVPGLADEAMFYYDPAEREKVRGELGLEGEILFVYSGSLAAWQLPEVVLEVWKRLGLRLARARLLLLTPEAERARSLVRQAAFPPPLAPLIRAARHEEVRGYLSAADLGLLLREPHPLNQVASPTKLAEYLLCGLAVLVSRGVGDSREMVAARGLGTVLESYDDPVELDQKVDAALQIAGDGKRAERARQAREILGLSARLDSWVEFYRQL